MAKKSDGTVISSYTYQYDSAGNPTKMTEANGDYTDYGYDNVYELTSEVMKDSGGTTIYSISWTYDNVGNRATQTKDGNQTSYTYNNMNQMSAAGSASFTYDSNGNTASKTENQATTNYTWNYENALTKIDNPSGDDYVYEYDGDGMRVRAGHDSGQGNVWDTRFYYDTGAPLYAYLFESDNDKNMTVAYTTDPYGNLISQRRSSATYYHLYDQLGSTRKLLDSSQATTDSYSYYAFGEIRSCSGSTANPFKFVGCLGYYDDPSTDFQYLRARYYGPAYGRFASRDRLGPMHSAYAYAANSPTAFVDPYGLWASRERCDALVSRAAAALDAQDCATANSLIYSLGYECAYDPLYVLVQAALNARRLSMCSPGGPCQAPVPPPVYQPWPPNLPLPPGWQNPVERGWGVSPIFGNRCEVTQAIEYASEFGAMCICYYDCHGKTLTKTVPRTGFPDCGKACYAAACRWW